MANLGLLLILGLVACKSSPKAPAPLDEQPEPAPEDPLATDSVEIERYPRMVMPDPVVQARETTVFVGLSETAGGSARAEVLDGDAPLGSLTMTLPALPDGVEAWTIDVILSAPGFTIAGDDFATIQLPPEGSSTMARFAITLIEVPASGTVDVRAYLFHEGAFMGHIGRTVAAVERPPPKGDAPLTSTVTRQGAAVRPAGRSHELHLLAIDDRRALVVINEPGKTMAHAVVDFERGRLPDFVLPKLAAIRSRGLDRTPIDPVGMDMVRGLGAQLWPLTPAPLRDHLLAIWDDPSVVGLRIYTNVPGFPWELVRPLRADETLEPLGMRFQLGRWHLHMGMAGLVVPPTKVDYRELVAMMPTYEGHEALPAVQRELAALTKMSAFRRIPGRTASLAQLVRDPPNGVIHFAGHGAAQSTDGVATRYALHLEDGAFDSTAFGSLEDKRLRERETVVFFNACELGRADAPANIVEGWAPVMLDAGASGYIGALWPVGDDEAAAFAEAFYDDVERSIATYGSAQVTEILRCLRRRGADRGDPTWQAYVFYGDPDTVLYRSDVTPTEPDGRYTCP